MSYDSLAKRHVYIFPSAVNLKREQSPQNGFEIELIIPNSPPS